MPCFKPFTGCCALAGIDVSSSAKHNTNPFIVNLSRFSELGHEPADEIVSRAVVSPRTFFLLWESDCNGRGNT